ncbi:MAG: SRPBCC family protein [Bacteroidia bacterium]|nr:SRPBCC family protein [Bacteroidia bacterium]
MTSEILNTTPDCEIVSTRIFHAERAQLFRAWSEPGHLQNWWGPKGFTNTFHAFDFRVGGKWSFIMHGPDKGNYANECEFIKIEEPVLIAWKRHTPPLFQVVATFEEIPAGQTRLVFKMLFETADACEKLKKIVVDKNEENFDRLESELSKMSRKAF